MTDKSDMIHNAVEDKIIDGLDFKLAPGASYVLNRRFVTFCPSGSNEYTPGGGLIRVVLTGANDWLDPSTLRVMFDLRNLETDVLKRLRPIGQPWSFFRRMRILVGGTLVEDIDVYNRVHQMFSQLTATDSRSNKMVEGGFVEMDILDIAKDQPASYNPFAYMGIKGGQAKTVVFKPLSGLFSQNRYLPLKYCGPIIIELELVSKLTDVIVQPNTAQTSTTTYMVAASTSTNWQIENVQVKCDVCTLDNQVENIFTKHMLDGGSFPISYSNYISQLQPTNGAQKVLMLSINRSATRLKSCFITLDKDSGTSEVLLVNRNWNEFWSPMAHLGTFGNMEYDSEVEFESYIQIGSKLFPEYPIRSHAEAFYQLTKCLGIQASDIHNVDISPEQYYKHKFIMGIDLEKVLEARGTGFYTRAGDVLTVYFKHNTNTTTRYADIIHTILVSENIKKRSDVGIEVFD
jgi:hypothetical protein